MLAGLPALQAVRAFHDAGGWHADLAITNLLYSPEDGRALGTNTIALVEEGGALLESWKSAGGGTGTSLSYYDPELELWHQVWVTRTSVLVTVGGLVDGSMVLEDLDASGDLTGRITWTPREDGTVRQHWEKTEDDGETWSTSFDGIYRRKGEGDR